MTTEPKEKVLGIAARLRARLAEVEKERDEVRADFKTLKAWNNDCVSTLDAAARIVGHPSYDKDPDRLLARLSAAVETLREMENNPCADGSCIAWTKAGAFFDSMKEGT